MMKKCLMVVVNAGLNLLLYEFLKNGYIHDF